MEYLRAFTGFLLENKDDIRNWLLAIVPAVSIYVTWRVGRRSARLENGRRIAKENAEAQDRAKQEQRLIHTENAEQTIAMTDQFRAVMEGYQSRVEDLSHEVTALRTEVTSLRKTLDRQRLLCSGCPKLPRLLPDYSDAPTADATA